MYRVIDIEGNKGVVLDFRFFFQRDKILRVKLSLEFGESNFGEFLFDFYVGFRERGRIGIYMSLEVSIVVSREMCFGIFRFVLWFVWDFQKLVVRVR